MFYWGWSGIENNNSSPTPYRITDGNGDGRLWILELGGRLGVFKEVNDFKEVDVHETEVAEFQFRDDGESEEGQNHVRVIRDGTKVFGDFFEDFQFIADYHQGFITQETGNGEWQIVHHFPVFDSDDTTLHFHDMNGGGKDVGISHSDDDDVVGIMRHGGTERTGFKSETFDQA